MKRIKMPSSIESNVQNEHMQEIDTVSMWQKRKRRRHNALYVLDSSQESNIVRTPSLFSDSNSEDKQEAHDEQQLHTLSNIAQMCSNSCAKVHNGSPVRNCKGNKTAVTPNRKTTQAPRLSTHISRKGKAVARRIHVARSCPYNNVDHATESFCEHLRTTQCTPSQPGCPTVLERVSLCTSATGSSTPLSAQLRTEVMGTPGCSNRSKRKRSISPKRNAIVRPSLPLVQTSNSPLRSKANCNGILTTTDMKLSIAAEIIETLMILDDAFKTTETSSSIGDDVFSRSTQRKRGLYASVREVRRSIVNRHPLYVNVSPSLVSDTMEWLHDLNLIQRFVQSSSGKQYYRLNGAQLHGQFNFQMFSQSVSRLPVPVELLQTRDGRIKFTMTCSASSFQSNWARIVSLALRTYM